MATLEEEDYKAVNGAGREPSAQRDEAGQQPYETPERGHVEALLDISEKNFLKDLDPYEYHCYCGWEEAVYGWARVAPLSCILLTQKISRKSKHKEAENPGPSSVDPTLSNADSSAGVAERRCESRVGQHHLKKSTTLNQTTGSWSQTAVAAQPPDVVEWSVSSAVARLYIGDKTEKEMLRETPLQPHHLSSKYPVSENRPTKHQKHSPSSNNTVVPIKNFTFLPPIKSPHRNPKASSRRAPEGEGLDETCFMLGKKSGTRGARLDDAANSDLRTYSAALTFNYQTCHHNSHLLSAGSVSVPKRYQVPMSPKPETLHRTSYSMGKSLSQAISQPMCTPAACSLKEEERVWCPTA